MEFLPNYIEFWRGTNESHPSHLMYGPIWVCNRSTIICIWMANIEQCWTVCMHVFYIWLGHIYIYIVRIIKRFEFSVARKRLCINYHAWAHVPLVTRLVTMQCRIVSWVCSDKVLSLCKGKTLYEQTHDTGYQWNVTYNISCTRTVKAIPRSNKEAINNCTFGALRVRLPDGGRLLRIGAAERATPTLAQLHVQRCPLAYSKSWKAVFWSWHADVCTLIAK